METNSKNFYGMGWPCAAVVITLAVCATKSIKSYFENNSTKTVNKTIKIEKQ